MIQRANFSILMWSVFIRGNLSLSRRYRCHILKPVSKDNNFEIRDLATLFTLHLRADITLKCRMCRSIVGDESGDSTKSDTTCSLSHSWLCIMR